MNESLPNTIEVQYTPSPAYTAPVDILRAIAFNAADVYLTSTGTNEISVKLIIVGTPNWYRWTFERRTVLKCSL
jgi:hypothetical protein